MQPLYQEFFIFLAKMPHLQHVLCISSLRVALWWQVWQENQYFNIFQAKKRVFLAQSHTASNRRSAVFSTQKWRFRNVPPHGTSCSTPWNKTFHPMEQS